MSAIPASVPIQQFFDNNGRPLFKGTLGTFAAGTTTPQATYVDSTQTTQNTNPITLNARGECALWLDPTLNYKLVLKDIFGNIIWTADNIPSLVSLGATVSWASDTFTTTAGQTVFTLSNSPTSLTSALVIIDGAVLIPSIDYTISGTTLTLTSGTLLNQTLYVSYLKNVTNAFQQNFVGANADVANVNFTRNANYSGGTAGFVNSTMRITDNVINAGSGPFEWAFTAVMNNSSTSGQQVAIYGQGNRMTNTAGATWAATFEYRDLSGQVDPNVGCVGIEIDMRASGTDAHTARVGSDLVVTRFPPNTGAAMHAFCGYRVQNGGDNSATVDNCYAVQSSQFGNGFTIFQGTTGVWGLNFAQAILTSGAALFPAGAPICFDANAFTALYWDGTGLRFDYGTSGRVSCFRANDDGSIAFGGSTLPIKMVGTTAATASSGGAGAPPANVAGYLNIVVGGTAAKVPYYAV